MQNVCWNACAAAILGSCILLSVPAHSDEIGDFYKGKQLQMYVGFGAGGANDIWARIVGRQLARHLPGAPTLVIQAMPGAGSLRLANYLYNVAPKDGSQIGIIARGVPFEPLYGGSGTEFDPRKLSYIGSPTLETTVCAVRTDLPHKGIKDFFVRETFVGTGGGGSETNLTPLTLNNVLGMKFKIIAGFKGGGTDVALAVERKELDGMCIGYSTLSDLPFYRSGGIRERFLISHQPDPELKNVPNIYDYEMNDEQRKLLLVTFAREKLGRPFVGPPEIPEARKRALRKAFAKAVADPELVAEAKKADLIVRATSGEDLERFVLETYSTTTPELARKAAQALGR